MQKQTEKYFDAIYAASSVRSSISGEIVTSDGERYELSDADIIPGSLEKNNKCVNGSSFELGAVYQGELNVTIRKSLDKYRIMGGSISFTEHRMLRDGGVEDVSIGKFYIASADRSKKLTTIKAVDSMGNLDMDIVNDMEGTPYELLTILAEYCGVCLAQSEESISALPNGQHVFAVSADTTGTYSDLAAYLGMLTGTFATMDVNDQLELRAYALNNCLEVPISKRENGSTVLADYVTYYKGLQARFIAQENYEPYEYVDEEIVDGLILDLGDIPIVRGGAELKKVILQTIFEVIRQIRYVPAEFTLVTSDAALELGDRVGISGEDANTYITSYSWVYHGTEQIKGVGDNPRLKTHGDNNSKQIAMLEKKVNAKDVIIHSYINASAYMIGQEEKKIISINFATTAATHPIFIATIPFSVDRDGIVVFKYYLDEVLMSDDTVRQYVSRGDHFVTLSNNMSEDENTRHTLAIKACTEYTESDIRQQSAKMMSLEHYISTGEYIAKDIDTTIPTANIAKNTIRAVLYAQGMARTGKWDGTINISDAIAPIATGRTIGMFSELMGLTAQEPIRAATVTEQFPAISIGTMTVGGISASIMLDETIEKYVFSAERAENYEYDDRYVTVDGSFQLNSLYSFAGSEQSISLGKLYSMTTETDQFASVQAIEVMASGSGKYLISGGGKYYDSSGGELEITELTPETFQEYGSDEPPESNILLEMDNPTVLLWADEDRSLAAAVTAVPYGQNVVSEAISLSHSSIHGIENAAVACEGALVCAVSVDREAWMAYDGSDWITLSEEYSGMSKDALESLTIDQWAALLGDSETMYIRISLAVPEQAVMSITVNFVNDR